MSENYDSLAYYRIKQLEETNERLKSQLMETNDTLEKANRDRNDLLRKLDTECDKRCDLQKQLDSLNTSLGRLREQYEEEVVCRRKWAKLAGYRDKRIEELQRQIELQDSVCKNCYDQGQTDLWVKLQDVKDMQPNEFDVECECLGDVLDMDLEDFLDTYKKWWEEEEKEKETEQKRLAYMRDYLHRFCLGKVCCGCPLNAPELKCYGHGGFDSISDEDLKRYYEKAWESFKEEKPSEEVPCSFGWKLEGTEFTIETSIPRKDYDNIVKIISGKE